MVVRQKARWRRKTGWILTVDLLIGHRSHGYFESVLDEGDSPIVEDLHTRTLASGSLLGCLEGLELAGNSVVATPGKERQSGEGKDEGQDILVRVHWSTPL